MNKEEVKELLERYLNGNCNQEERALLEAWYIKYENKHLTEIAEQERSKRLSKIRNVLQDLTVTRKRSLKMYYVAAAAVLAVMAIGVYFYVSPAFKQNTDDIADARKIPAGKNTAILTLSNGKKIDLNQNQNGILIAPQGMVYPDGSKVQGVDTEQANIEYAWLSTPMGGQYQIVLSDGTKVWLNAASKLKYPIQFVGKERKVEIVGEAYFEVAHMKSTPFKVQSGRQVIEVLGTHFNVSAYPEEKVIKTTLLQGRVSVSRLPDPKKARSDGQYGIILHPGEQAQLSNETIGLHDGVDLEEITAWKNGYFKFGGSLESIMDKVARWYNVEVSYEDDFGGKLKFVGKISRAKNLAELLEVISSAGDVHFKVKGRRVVVMK